MPCIETNTVPVGAYISSAIPHTLNAYAQLRSTHERKGTCRCTRARTNHHMQVAILSLLSSLPMLGNIMLGGIFFMIVWGILGMQLYQCERVGGVGGRG